MFGMTRDLGRKKQERRKNSNRLPKGAYTLDKRLVPRVKEVHLAAKPLIYRNSDHELTIVLCTNVSYYMTEKITSL